MTTGQYFDDEPSVASDPRPVEISLPDLAITLTADRGVFSAEHLDAGTKLLLQESPPLTTADRTILDLGCGWGPIACVAAPGHLTPESGRSMSTSGASAHRRQRRNDRCWGSDHCRSTRRGGRRRAIRSHPLQSTDPNRQAGTSRPSRPLADTDDPRRRCTSRRAKTSRERLARSLARGGRASGRPDHEPCRLPYPSGRSEGEHVTQLDGTGMKRLHREWRRRTDGRPRSCSMVSATRSTSERSCARGGRTSRPSLPRQRDCSRPRQGQQDGARHRSVPHLDRVRLRRPCRRSSPSRRLPGHCDRADERCPSSMRSRWKPMSRS